MAWAPDYVTLDELKSYVGITYVLEDAELSLAVSAASRAIDNRTSRQFGRVTAAEERYYTAEYSNGTWAIPIDDLMTTTGLVLKIGGTTISSDGYRLTPRNAAAKGTPWTEIELTAAAEATPSAGDEIAITASWGWSSVPNQVKLATLLQASRFAARRQAPFGVAPSPADGTDIILRASLDPDVHLILSPYTRRVWAA